MNNPITREYYENSNFSNVGLWEKNIISQKEACLHLMQTLVANVDQFTGTALDVACGIGGTTAFLAKHFEMATVRGINISANQIEICKVNYPDLEFHEMDATLMNFPDQSFDLICCVEAPFHFNKRADFIQECYRILKYNGKLIICDVLMEPKEQLDWFLPPENKEKTVRDYELLLESKGFKDYIIIDKTIQTYLPYSQKLRKWAIEQYFYKKIGINDYNYILSLCKLLINNPINNYLFISAVKTKPL